MHWRRLVKSWAGQLPAGAKFHSRYPSASASRRNASKQVVFHNSSARHGSDNLGIANRWAGADTPNQILVVATAPSAEWSTFAQTLNVGSAGPGTRCGEKVKSKIYTLFPSFLKDFPYLFL